jgi:hypothetical protein
VSPSTINSSSSTIIIPIIVLAVIAVFVMIVFCPLLQSFFLPSSLGLFQALYQSRAPRQGSAMNSGCASAL